MKKLYLIAAALITCTASWAQKQDLSPEQIEKNAPGLSTPLPKTYGWADNTHYYTVGDRGAVAINIKNGKTTLYKIPAEKIAKEEVKIKDGYICYYDETGAEKQLGKASGTEKNPTVSPDHKQIAFTRDNNLFTVSIETGAEKQLTFDGTDLIMNGYASWVYYEEILGRAGNYRAFWWSPDSRTLIFFRSDDTNVPMFPIYSSEGQHGFLELTRYPKAGDPNPEVRIGFVSIDNGNTVWADFDPRDDQYFGQPFWTPDGRQLWMQWMNREQDNLKIYNIDIATGSKKEVYDEHQSTWIDWIEDIRFVSDGFLMVRDYEGWEHIYYHGLDGKFKARLTGGTPWGTKFVKVDEKGKTVYFTTRGEVSTRHDFYSATFDGKKQKRLSFGDYSFDKILLSPDNKHYIADFSNAATPTRRAVANVANQTYTVIADSYNPAMEQYNVALPEMVSITTPDGYTLPGIITYPIRFDPAKKYPVLIDIYGGPNAGSVYDTWKGFRNQRWAYEGVIHISIDHRASGHCGKQGLNFIHRQLLKWEMNDYIEWVKWLREKPCVNAQKIGITGSSYGGTMVAMALTYGHDYFQYGEADFGVQDWHLYDSHYTERYMDRPQDNPEGYRLASPITYVDLYNSDGRNSMLRVVHGTMDDNVHLQNSIQLIDALQENLKEFEMMIYPGGRHGWGGNKGKHYRTQLYDFYLRYLLEE